METDPSGCLNAAATAAADAPGVTNCCAGADRIALNALDCAGFSAFDPTDCACCTIAWTSDAVSAPGPAGEVAAAGALVGWAEAVESGATAAVGAAASSPAPGASGGADARMIGARLAG